jgi:phosphate/sulfate permease
MKTLIGGVIAAALGLIGIVIWWGQFLMVLAGTIPAMLLLGGALAIYLGFDELKDTWKKEKDEESTETTGAAGEDVEKYKKEINELKGEIDDLKKE